MHMPFSYDEEPEKYSSFKKRKFHDYQQKAKRLLTGINDLSLKPKDKLKLREELSLILSVPQHETSKVSINKQTKEVNYCPNCGQLLVDGREFCNSECEYDHTYN